MGGQARAPIVVAALLVRSARNLNATTNGIHKNIQTYKHIQLYIYIYVHNYITTGKVRVSYLRPPGKA